eukprot:364453-Chlamydomonas_euryale.AAC.14
MPTPAAAHRRRPQPTAIPAASTKIAFPPRALTPSSFPAAAHRRHPQPAADAATDPFGGVTVSRDALAWAIAVTNSRSFGIRGGGNGGGGEQSSVGGGGGEQISVGGGGGEQSSVVGGGGRGPTEEQSHRGTSGGGAASSAEKPKVVTGGSGGGGGRSAAVAHTMPALIDMLDHDPVAPNAAVIASGGEDGSEVGTLAPHLALILLSSRLTFLRMRLGRSLQTQLSARCAASSPSWSRAWRPAARNAPASTPFHLEPRSPL